MNRALRWVRKSKGQDDDVGLELQREKTRELAESLADKVDTLDLGVYTGFSIHSRAPDEERIDANPEVETIVEDLEAGKYDFLVAFNDTRLARDQYFATIERACLVGDAEIQYVEDVEDGMSFELQRTVEKHMKQKEIAESKKARARRREKGYYEGRPRWGTQYDDARAHLEPAEGFEDALLAIEMREEQDASYNDILAETSVGSTGTLRNILDRAEWYRNLADRHGVEESDLPAAVAADD